MSRLIATRLFLSGLFTSVFAMSAVEIYAAKPKGEITGKVQSRDLNETSGIAASRVNPGLVWLHNDGHTNQLFGVRTTGETAAVLEWRDAVVDLEDVASGPGPTPEQDYLYIGDFGDNKSRRPQVRVYRTIEPTIKPTGRPQYVSTVMEDFRFTYPDGPVDAEALLVDPLSGDIIIVTKEKKQARVFRAPNGGLKPKQTVELEEVVTLGVANISGGDISRDGKWILLRSEKEGWLWPHNPQLSLSETFSRNMPRAVPVRQKSQSKNGEGISFEPNSSGYFTISEGNNQPLARFSLPDRE